MFSCLTWCKLNIYILINKRSTIFLTYSSAYSFNLGMSDLYLADLKAMLQKQFYQYRPHPFFPCGVARFHRVLGLGDRIYKQSHRQH